jgi:hypothetical protein
MDAIKFRDLTAKDIDVRIGQIGDGYFTLLLYKDARVDMDILDESGYLWQRKHYEVKGNLFCSVGIKINDEWVWRDDCGVESNVDKEKGEASDSFKRACVNWGIGRELYTSPKIFVNCECKKGDKALNFSNFKVNEIAVKDKAITHLKISAYNKQKNSREVVFVMGESKKPALQEQKPADASAQKQTAPANRAKELIALINGTDIKAENIALTISDKFGKQKASELTEDEYAELYDTISRLVNNNA